MHALKTAFEGIGNKTSQNIWLEYFQPKTLGIVRSDIRAPHTYKLELSSNGINLDATNSKEQLRYDWVDLSNQYFENGWEQKDPESYMKGYKPPTPATKSDDKKDGKAPANAKGDTGAEADKKYGGLLKIVCTLSLSLMVLLN